MPAYSQKTADAIAKSGIPMSANEAPQDLAGSLEAAFAKVRTEAEAKQAAQLAADSVPTDNIAVLRERAERHAHEAVDQYWGHFNDMQRMLAERAIAPLLHTVSRIVAERDEHRAAAEALEAKLRKIGHGCETPESHLYGCPCQTQPVADAIEYGIRIPDGEVLLDGVTTDRRDQEARLGRYRDVWPDAVLVQRPVFHGEWTEAVS